MVITATEFKTNLGRYITLADMEDVIITRNGRSVAKLTNARDAKLLALHSMRGVLKSMDVSAGDIRAERLAKYDEAAD